MELFHRFRADPDLLSGERQFSCLASRVQCGELHKINIGICWQAVFTRNKSFSHRKAALVNFWWKTGFRCTDIPGLLPAKSPGNPALPIASGNAYPIREFIIRTTSWKTSPLWKGLDYCLSKSLGWSRRFSSMLIADVSFPPFLILSMCNLNQIWCRKQYQQ